MENWGLITVRSSSALYHPRKTWSDNETKMKVAILMAHEVAHQVLKNSFYEKCFCKKELNRIKRRDTVSCTYVHFLYLCTTFNGTENEKLKKIIHLQLPVFSKSRISPIS
jgi:hypothetical protein